MPATEELRARFAQLHAAHDLLLLPNAWDPGSAKLLAAMGFEAVATTSGGFAASLGRLDHSVTAEEALGHAVAIAAAVPNLPVSADLENGFAPDPAGVAATVDAARAAGLAGCSVEDASDDGSAPIYGLGHAAERVAAAVEAAHRDRSTFTLTARADNALNGIDDLGDTIARLQAYEREGADVLFAPGLVDIDAIRRVVESVTAPVNVLLVPGSPPVSALRAAGVRRVSVGCLGPSTTAVSSIPPLLYGERRLCAPDGCRRWC